MNYDYLTLNELLSVADTSCDPLVCALVKRFDLRDDNMATYHRDVSSATPPQMLQSLSDMKGKTVFNVLDSHNEVLAMVFTDSTVIMLSGSTVGSECGDRASIDVTAYGIERYFTPEQLVKAGAIHPLVGEKMRAEINERDKKAKEFRLERLRKEIAELEKGVS